MHQNTPNGVFVQSQPAVNFQGLGFLRLALVGLAWLAPLGASAEERDAAEIGHGIVVLGLITSFFLFCLAFSVWLLIAKLRQSDTVEPPRTVRHPNLEPLWFPRSSQDLSQEAPDQTTTKRS